MLEGRRAESRSPGTTYYCCRSEAASRGLNAGALCNKPNKEVIDRSTGSSPPAGARAAGRSLFWSSALRVLGLERPVLSFSALGWTWRSKRVFWPACKLEKTSGSGKRGGGTGGWACIGQGAPTRGEGAVTGSANGLLSPSEASLLSGIESLSLPPDQTGDNQPAGAASRPNYTHTHTHTRSHTLKETKRDTNAN